MEDAVGALGLMEFLWLMAFFVLMFLVWSTRSRRRD